MSVFILHTTLLNWWETTFIYLLIHRMICIRVTHSLSLSLTVGGIQKKKERKTDPRGLHLSVLHAKRVSVLLCHFISFHPQTARGDRHVTSLSHDIHTSFSKRVIRILVGLLVGWKLLSPSDTKFLQGPSHAHSSSEVQIQSLPGKVKVGKKKRPTKDRVLHRHLHVHIHPVTEGKQPASEVQIESFPGRAAGKKRRNSVQVICGSGRVVNSCHIALPAVAAANMQGQELCWCDVAIECIHQGWTCAVSDHWRLFPLLNNTA